MHFRKIFFIMFIFLSGVVFSQDFQKARSMCENYGFTPNTSPFAQCVQNEVHNQQQTAQGNSQADAQRQSCLKRNEQIQSRVASCRWQCLSKAGQIYNGIINYLPGCTEGCDLQLSAQLPC